MKSLVIDSASARMTVAAKNDDYTTTVILDIGPKQSQELLPAIDYVISRCGMKVSELDYTALCKGPGTFTGLRLAFSALKAIELAHSVPVYAVPTLEVYAFPYKNFEGKVVSIIDAKKDQFFAAVYKNGNEIMPPEDSTADSVMKNIQDNEPVMIAGPDAPLFAELLKKTAPSADIRYLQVQPPATEAVSALAEDMIKEKKEPLKDFEGPEYLRKSEAEIALESKAQKD